MELSDEILSIVLEKVGKNYINQLKGVCNRWDYIAGPKYNQCECDECMNCGEYSLVVAVSNDHINCVKYIMKWKPYTILDIYGLINGKPTFCNENGDFCLAIEEVAVSVECLKILCKYSKEFNLFRAKIGHLEMLKWMKTQGYPMYKDYFLEAAEFGCLDCLKWLRENKIDTEGIEKPEKDDEEDDEENNFDPCSFAAIGGNIDCLKYLIKEGYKFNNEIGPDCELIVLQFMVEYGYTLHSDTCYFAALKGNLENLVYAHDHGVDWNARTCEAAAEGGKIEILKYLHEHGVPWNVRTCYEATKAGHLECLQYAHENGCPVHIRLLDIAVGFGRIECLEYLHNHGFPLNLELCTIAARVGNLRCLKYLHEHGCPWDKRVLQKAKENNYMDCYNYAISQGLQE